MAEKRTLLPEQIEQFLTELARSAYAHQNELDELAWRSVPFFATALGAAILLTGQLVSAIPHAAGSKPLLAAVYILIFASSISFAVSLWTLFRMIDSKAYHAPPPAIKMIEFFRRRSTELEDQKIGGRDTAPQLWIEILEYLSRKYSEIENRNRELTKERLVLRGRLIRWLAIGFFCSLACHAILFARSAWLAF